MNQLFLPPVLFTN